MLLLLLLLIAASPAALPAAAHEHHDDGSAESCEMSPDARIVADYRPGIVTIDGHADEWGEVEGLESSLLPALDPDEDKAYDGGKMTVKEIVQMLKTIGKELGGTPRLLFIQLHFFIQNCNLSNGLVEEDSPYAKSGTKGTYNFEFSRPLRTMDRFQQVSVPLVSNNPCSVGSQIRTRSCYIICRDVTGFSNPSMQDAQFVIGKLSKVAVAFWYPQDGNPWSGSQHFSASCEWLPLDIASPSGSSLARASSSSSWDAATAFALLMSVVSFCLSVFIGYRLSRSKETVSFIPMNPF